MSRLCATSAARYANLFLSSSARGSAVVPDIATDSGMHSARNFSTLVFDLNVVLVSSYLVPWFLAGNADPGWSLTVPQC